MVKHVVSKKRVSDHGEVYTREQEVNAMLDLVKPETERIDSRFLEPACGTGNFLVEILNRKLNVVKSCYKRNQSDYERYAFLAISSLYGIDILLDNIKTCQSRLFYQLDEQYSYFYQKKTKDTFRGVIRFVLERNIIRGDALTLQTVEDTPQPIVFAEWSFVRGNQIKRRDFAFHELLPGEGNLPLFLHPAPKSDQGETAFIPKPVKDYPLCHFMRIADAD